MVNDFGVKYERLSVFTTLSRRTTGGDDAAATNLIR